MEVHQALVLGRSLMREHGLTGWSLVVDRAKTRAGVCRHGRRQIGISGPLTALHDEAEVRDTLLHEIAHALVGPQHGHDEVWRAKAVEIGSSGERCVSPDAPRLRGDWEGRCPSGHVKYRHRAPVRPMSCGFCARRFDPQNLLVWTYRGRRVAMPENYRLELAGLESADQRRRDAARLELGDVVEITAAGSFTGQRGELEFVGFSRVQVRLTDGTLVGLSLDDVTAARESAA